MTLQQHPLSAAFPAMPEQEVEALAMDIEKHGQREPGVLFEGMVLDGWHRYVACEKVGAQFRHVHLNGEDPVSFVLSRNLHRRHLTASQRAASIVACTNWRASGVTNSRVAAAATLSNKSLAEKAEVSERTIRNAKTAHAAGLGDAVKDGRVSAERAAEIAKLPPRKRDAALDAPPKEKKPTADAAELAKLQKTVEELREQNGDLADTARELSDKLTAFETTDPDEQQKEIQKLQKRIVRLEAEVQRLTVARNDCQNKNNELIREVKRLQKKLGAAQ